MKSTPISPSTSPSSSSFSSPNCVRSLEAQLEKASLMSTTPEASNDDDHRNNNTTTEPISWTVVRDRILQLTIVTGNLSSLFLMKQFRTTLPTADDYRSSTSTETNHQEALSRSIVTVFQVLWEISHSLHIPLSVACQNKINLNNRKYPVDLCKGKSGKYTEYSQHTGITKTSGQSTRMDEPSLARTTDSTNNEGAFWHSSSSMIASITQQTRQFAIDREWEQYHTPRNLLLALIGELGELAELVQWHGDEEQSSSQPRVSERLLDQLAQELADVTIYLMRLADVCHVDLAQEVKQYGGSEPTRTDTFQRLK